MATGLVLVLGAIATAVFEGKPEAVSPEQRADPARLGSVDSNRYRYWDVALETWADRPLRGIGSGGFQVEWLKQRDRVDTSATPTRSTWRPGRSSALSELGCFCCS